MSQTNVQTFSGDVEITGGLSVTGTVISTVGTDKVQLTTTSASETDYIPVSKGATGAQALYTDSNLTYNPSTNQIAANLSGNVTGNVSGNLTGNVSGNIAGSADTVAFTARNATNNTDYIAFVDTATAGDKALFTDANLTYNSSNNHLNANVPYANNAGTLDGASKSTGANANSIAQRDGEADIFCRLVRQTYTNQNDISGAMAFRVDNGNNNYVRFCSNTGSIRTFLNVPTRTGGNASGTWSI